MIDEGNKKHADFQDAYRRSSNFRSVAREKEESNFEIKKSGKLAYSSTTKKPE